MELNNTRARYSWPSIMLHWFMLLLLVAVYASMELREGFPKGSDTREALKSLHYVLGLSVLWLAVLRLVVYWWGSVPAIVPAPARWQQAAAQAMKVALYLFMFSMPVLGWALLSADGKSLSYLGFQLPALVGASESLAESLEEVHESVATLGYFLVGAHACAALFHHYLLRDNTLRRMLPFGGGRPRR